MKKSKETEPVSDLVDRAAREAALDTARSVLVQAPAGSGKTELLAMRILKLLAVVENPEQVLGITFTKAATAEMRRRILGKLDAAKRQMETGVAQVGEDPAYLEIAHAALENSDRRNWRLLEQPHRLNITTIDSLCLRIARQMPLRAGLGGMLEPVEDARLLYRKAARKTLDRLSGEDHELRTALRELLLLRDSNLEDCESLLAEMLATRDQWKHVFPLGGDIDWEKAKARLELPFQREIQFVLSKTRNLLSENPSLVSELLDLANYACETPETAKFKIQKLAGVSDLPPALPEFLEEWLCLCKLLMTENDKPRKSYDARQGFPAKNESQRARMLSVVKTLTNLPGFFEMLRGIRELPPPQYSGEQWKILRHMFTALRQAVRELTTVFAEEGRVDFVEIGMAALDVLRAGTAPDFSDSIRHLLVDEFQDTSRRQHELIAELVSGWRPGDGRTIFLVGDPMQSIYMFRQADVELFSLVRDRGFETADGSLPVATLQLETNFRSNAGVVNPLNEIFKLVFPHAQKAGSAAVDFLPGTANDLCEPKTAYTVHPDFLEKQPKETNGAPDPSLERLAQQRETDAMMQIICRHLPKVEQARQEGQEFTLAVLARAKEHLLAIARALREEKVPFRAIELETLGKRQEVLDLRSLTRALLHPMDRIAWLALLRAPWCGLTLQDLHLLCGTDTRRYADESVQKEIESRSHLLDKDSQQRVDHLLSVLQAALRVRHSQTSLAVWVERTWRSLGGPDCIDAAGYENALAYFEMLDEIATDGIAATGEAMDDRLVRLFASPDPAVGERQGVQLMTIHKAKGLGFNVVLLPALHRKGKQDDPPLIRYLERSADTESELLVAPIGAKGESTSVLNGWIRKQKSAREAEERKRLLYVACTRAREELHLFATATVTNNWPTYQHDSLLETAWPALEQVFMKSFNERKKPPKSNIVTLTSAAPIGGSGIIPSLAASATPTLLRRLPLDWKLDTRLKNVTVSATISENTIVKAEDERSRPQASRASRSLGTIVHALFERAAGEFEKGVSGDDIRSSLPTFQKYAVVLGHQEGLSPNEAEQCSKEATVALESALNDPYGRWILKSHPEAQTETSWTGVVDGAPRVLRIDRSFLSGPEPLSEGDEYMWIVDYKTADHSSFGLDVFFASERCQYERQLEDYGKLMRLVRGEDLKLRLGLYYPLLKKLVWWPA